MKRRWYVFAALAAAIAATGVLLVPERPRWTDDCRREGLLIGFSADGHELLSSASTGTGEDCVLRRDAATGQVVGQTVLADPIPGFTTFNHSPAGTGTAVLNNEGPQYECRVYGANGERRATIPVSRKDAGRFVWSPDGRWLAVWLGDPAAWSVVDVATGREAFRLPAVAGRAGQLAFAHDGESVAVLHIPDAGPTLTRYAVPSGAVLNRVAMPAGLPRLGPVVGSRVVVELAGRPVLLDCSGDTAVAVAAPDLAAVEASDRAYWHTGPGWCARDITNWTLPLDARARNWLATKVGGIAPVHTHHSAYAVFDPATFACRGRVGMRAGNSTAPSPDGRWVAGLDPKAGVSCWPAPTPRGPRMAAAGAGAGVAVLLLGRWRGRRVR